MAKDRVEYIAKASYNATKRKMKRKQKLVFNDNSEKLKYSQKHARKSKLSALLQYFVEHEDSFR